MSHDPAYAAGAFKDHESQDDGHQAPRSHQPAGITERLFARFFPAPGDAADTAASLASFTVPAPGPQA